MLYFLRIRLLRKYNLLIQIALFIGYYIASYQDQGLLNTATIESMTKHMVDELTIGAYDCPEIKCGFIGEVGSSYPIIGKLKSFLDRINKILIKIYETFRL